MADQLLQDAASAASFDSYSGRELPTSGGFFSDTPDLASQEQYKLASEYQAEKAKEDTSFSEGFQKAWTENSGWLVDASPVAESLVDQNYVHTAEKHKAMLKAAGADDAHIEYFNQPIYSDAHAQLLVDHYKESRANEEYMGKMGVGMNLAANLTAGVLDPVGIASMFATGGAAAAYRGYRIAKMVKAGVAVEKAEEVVHASSRLANAAKMAGVGAAENVAIVKTQEGLRPTYTDNDLYGAAGFGALFGGLVGGAMKVNARAHMDEGHPLSGENRDLHTIGEGMESDQIRREIEAGTIEVPEEIRRIYTDPTITDPTTEIGVRYTEAEARIKSHEEAIAQKEADLKALEEGIPTQDSPLVSREAQVKNAKTETASDYTKLLPENIRAKVGSMQGGEVHSDLRTPSSAKGASTEAKATLQARKKSVEDFTRGLLNQFLPDQRVYLTSSRGVLPAKALKNIKGCTVRLANDVFQITIPNTHLREDKVYSTIAHEIGHQVVNVHFKNAPPSVRLNIYKEYQKYLSDVKDMKDGQLVSHTRFSPDAAGEAHLSDTNPAQQLAGSFSKNYLFSFDEYMAETFARHVQQEAIAINPEVRSYFDTLIEKLKSLFGKIDGHLKVPEHMTQFFNDIRAGKYNNAQKITDAALKEQLEKDLEKLRAELGDANAFKTAYSQFVKRDTAKELAKAAPETVMGNVRFDVASYLLGSPNPIMRRIGALLVNDPVGLKDGAIQGMTAEEGQRLLAIQHEHAFYSKATPLFQKWKMTANLSFRERFNAGSIFYKRVGEELLGTTSHNDPEVKAVADLFRERMVAYTDDINDIGRVEGKVGLGGLRTKPLDADPDYVPRYHDMMKWHDTENRFGSQVVLDFFKNAMMKANGALDETRATKLAKGYIRNIRNRDIGDVSNLDAAYSGRDMEKLHELLMDSEEFTKDEVDEIINDFTIRTGKTQSASNSRMRRRAFLDDSYRMKVGDEELSIADFVETDAEKIFNKYNRQMSGSISLARVGFRTDNDFQKYVQMIADSARSMRGYYGTHRFNEEMANLDFAYKRIKGIPINPDNFLTATAGMLQKYNFIRLMGQMGYAQFLETSNILGNMGLKVAIQSLPTLKSFLRDVRTGQLNDTVMHEMEMFLGNGADLIKGHHNTENFFDGTGKFQTQTGNKIYNTLTSGLDKATQATTVISGFRAVNVTLQKWTAKSIAQKFTDAALKDASKIKPEFRQMMGLSDTQYDAILGQIKTYAKTEKGAVFGKNIKALNLDQWDDKKAAADFVMGAHRWSRRMVQENDVGSMTRFLGTTLGSLLLQFRSFTLNAWGKSTLYGIHNGTTEQAMSVLYGAALGSMLYAGRLYVSSEGRSDREAYLEKHLDPLSIVVNGLSRTTQASLIPGLIDSTVAPLMLGHGVFTEGRSTGLSQSMLGNPTFDLIDTIGGIPQGLHDSVGDNARDTSEKQIRKRLSLLPFQNAIGVQQALNVLAQKLD